MENNLENVFERFTSNLKHTIRKAIEVSRIDAKNKNKTVTIKHVFLAMISNKSLLAAKLLEKLNVDLDKTYLAIFNDVRKYPTRSTSEISKNVRLAIAESVVIAADLNIPYVGTEHLLIAILKLFSKEKYVKDLIDSGLTYEKVRDELVIFANYENAGLVTPAIGEENKQTQDVLDFFGKNLNKTTNLDSTIPIIGRDTEIERLIQILGRKSKRNPILIGESGVGKTAIVEGLVQKLLLGLVPSSIANMEIIQIDTTSIIAGAKIRGDIEERILSIMSEIEKDPDKVLFIDEIHMIVGAGNNGAGGPDIANILKPFMTGSNMRIIGSTTIDEYRKYFEDDNALIRRFQPINISEIDLESTKKIMKFAKESLEDHHQILIDESAVEDAINLSIRYINDRYLPDKAIDVLDEAASKKKLLRERKDKKLAKLKSKYENILFAKYKAIQSGETGVASFLRKEENQLNQKFISMQSKDNVGSLAYKVTEEDVREVISNWTKIPVNHLTSEGQKKIINLDGKMNKFVIGQSEAILKVSSIIKKAQIGLQDQSKPMASFLFLGPTGVGKTETAKVIAKEVFGSDDKLIQINMSELMESHSISKIIGAPPGYIGYQDGNHVSEKIRKNPYSVILFDEIEKSHPDILNLLLQVLDEGYLEDSKGRKISFRNSVIVMTSNIGAEVIAEDKTLGFLIDINPMSNETVEIAYDEMRSRVMSELKDYLRPEFINRIDDVIVFRGLNEENMYDIVRLQSLRLKSRLNEKSINLIMSSKLLKLVAKEGFSKEYGARNVKRKISEIIESPLTDYILENNTISQARKLKDSGLPMLEISSGIKSGKIFFKQDV